MGRTNKFHWKTQLDALVHLSRSKPAGRSSVCWWRGLLLRGTEAPNCQPNSESWKPATCLEPRSRMSRRDCQNSSRKLKCVCSAPLQQRQETWAASTSILPADQGIRLRHSSWPYLEYCVQFCSLHIQEGQGKTGEEPVEGIKTTRV